MLSKKQRAGQSSSSLSPWSGKLPIHHRSCRMATGIEIAGIVLAVAPLCFTVLKNYENDLRPYRALVKLRNEYAASERDLRLRFVILSMQMETLLLQSGIWNEGQTMEAYVKTYSSDIWDNAAQKEKLVAHLGILEYEHGFETILRYIRKHISEIASVLGLGAFGESDRDGVSSFTVICVR